MTFFLISAKTSIILIICSRQTSPRLTTDLSRRNEPYRNENGKRLVKGEKYKDSTLLMKGSMNSSKQKGKYFDITFSNENIVVIVLNSFDAYKHEGDALHHCVFSNDYYDRKDSLILSARLIEAPDIPIETIELSLTDGQILQCYGSHNKEAQYHNEIISLVNQHSHLILAA